MGNQKNKTYVQRISQSISNGYLYRPFIYLIYYIRFVRVSIYLFEFEFDVRLFKNAPLITFSAFDNIFDNVTTLTPLWKMNLRPFSILFS